MAGTLVKKVTLKIVGDDADAEEKLRRITEKAEELKRLHPEIAPRVDIAAASAKLAVLREELKKTGKAAQDAGGPTGLFGKLLGGLKSQLGGPGSKGFMGMSADAGPSGGMLTALVAIVPAVEALLVEANGLVSGFAAAGAGAGAFALLALPAFKKVQAGYTAVNTAHQAYLKSLAIEKMSPSTAHMHAVTTALLNQKAALAGMNPAERGAVKSLQGFMDSLHKLQTAFEPTAFKVLNAGLKVAAGLLPVVTPFARTFANVLDGLLKQTGKFTQSAGFKDWISQFHKLEGPALGAIGKGVGAMAVAFGKLLTNMSAKDVVNSINIAFSVLSGTISFTALVVRRLMVAWDTYSSAFRRVRHDIASGGHDIARGFDLVRHAGAQLAAGLRSSFDQDRHDIRQWGHDVVHDGEAVINWFKALPGKITGFFKALPGEMLSIGKNIISGLISGIQSAAGGVLSAIGSIASSIPHSIMGFLGIHSPSTVMRTIGTQITQGLIQGLEGTAAQVSSAASTIASDIQSAITAGMISPRHGQILTEWMRDDNLRLQGLANKRAKILKDIQTAQAYSLQVRQSTIGAYNITSLNPPGALTGRSLLGALGTSLTQIQAFAKNVRKLAREGLNHTLLDQIIQAGPITGGPVAAALAASSLGDIKRLSATEESIVDTSKGLGKMAANAMYDTGRYAGRGFLSGLQHQQRAIEDLMKRIARSMVNVLRRELGIRSPSTVFRQHGQMVIDGLVLGIGDRIPNLDRAMRAVGAHTSAGGGGRGMGGGGITVEIHVPRGGGGLGEAFWKEFANGIRVKGGDPRIVNHRVVLA